MSTRPAPLLLLGLSACVEELAPPPALELPVEVLPVRLEPEVPADLSYEAALGLPSCDGDAGASPFSLPIEPAAREDAEGAAFATWRLLPDGDRTAASLSELAAWVQVVAWDPSSAEGALVHEDFGSLVVQKGGASFSFVLPAESRRAFGDEVCLSTRLLGFTAAGPESRCVVGASFFEATLLLTGLSGTPSATLPDWAVGPIDAWDDPTLLTTCR